MFAIWGYARIPLASWSSFAVAYSPVAFLVTGILSWQRRARWLPRVSRALDQHTEWLDSIPDRRLGLWIVLAAALGLYAELMLIRVHSSYFQLFAYFKNISLLSCFLGLGVGFMLGPRKRVATPLVLPALALQIGGMYVLRYQPSAEWLQNPVLEQLALGMDQARETQQILAVYGFLVAVFAFNALCFVPLGHLVSRLMGRMEKLRSYSWNLLGSLFGIFLFYLLSFFWTPPSVWFGVTLLMFLPFLWKPWRVAIPSLATGGVLLILLNISFRSEETDIFSPYQILTLEEEPGKPPELRVNNVYFQRMLDYQTDRPMPGDTAFSWADHYDLPYRFGPTEARVLVVGSGTGNDVAAAVRNGAGSIQAVEIDPAILRLGRELHPAAPYAAPNVTATVADARAFIGRTEDQYDLIIYGLLDSHTLLSGLSGVRLDSYVYTVEALRQARLRLREDGLIVMTFSLIGTRMGRKLFLMLEEAFDGERPVVIRTEYDAGYTFLVGEDMAGRSIEVPPRLTDVTSAFASSSLEADVSTDDWPFFYMPVRTYPRSYIAMILLLLGISVLFVRNGFPRTRNLGLDSGLDSSEKVWSGPCFFLGAGFMLVETKGITELALVFGSTWVVVGAVIAAILVMAFLANVFVIRWGAPRPTVTYGLLLVSLALGLLVSRDAVAGFGPGFSQVVLTGILTLPLFFSGFAFSTELKGSPSVAVALSSNLLGAMLGGFLEYNSMYFGFRSLYFLAGAMYLLAFLGSAREARAAGAMRPQMPLPPPAPLPPPPLAG
jgi:SAM-dependent methyltransferase